MLTQELVVEIHVLHRQGMSIRRIAEKLNISRNTVRRYLRDARETKCYGPRPLRPSKLDPYKPYLQERIEAAKPHWIPAIVLFREIQSRGYPGKEGMVRIYLRQFKSKPNVKIVRFETAPGQQLQVDFTTIRRGQHKLKAFVATLGYSRAAFVRFSQFERQDDWITGIESALHYFGGVPQDLLFDNAKCIMIERDAYGEGRHRWNAALLATAQHYGFRLRACRPYRAKTKGKVERFNGYLKRSFITPLAASLKQAGLILDAETANGYVGPWLHDVAHQRIHGTTGEKPQGRLEEERLKLWPLSPDLTCQEPLKSNTPMALPVESLQHPLGLYDRLLEVVR